jgi:glutamate carboxypeptidase
MGRTVGLRFPARSTTGCYYLRMPVRSRRDITSLMSSSSRAQSPLTPGRALVGMWIRAPGAGAPRRAVDINSGTQNHAGVRAVGKLFASELEGLGFATRWVDGAPFGRAGHLVAERARPGKRFLLIGHLDTVFEADSPFQKFERVNERQARGPGIIDMKGGDVIIVQALKALHLAGALDRLHVTVVMTGDEESAGDPQAVARRARRRGQRRRCRARLRGWRR